jgi:hypothetical protein
MMYMMDILKLYMLIRSAHGIYVSFTFLKWIIISFYSSLIWIISYIPSPLPQLKDKELYSEIEIGDYIIIKNK